MWCFTSICFDFSLIPLYIFYLSRLSLKFFFSLCFKKSHKWAFNIMISKRPELNKTWNYISNSELIYYRSPEVGRLYDMNSNKLLYIFMLSYFDNIISDEVLRDDLNLWSENKSEKEIFNEHDVASLEHKEHGYGKFT